MLWIVSLFFSLFSNYPDVASTSFPNLGEFMITVASLQHSIWNPLAKEPWVGAIYSIKVDLGLHLAATAITSTGGPWSTSMNINGETWLNPGGGEHNTLLAPFQQATVDNGFLFPLAITYCINQNNPSCFFCCSAQTFLQSILYFFIILFGNELYITAT
jgi:hypothetical protein